MISHEHPRRFGKPEVSRGTTELVRPIVAAVDNRPGSQLALRWAVQTARARRLPLHVVLVTDRPATSSHADTPPWSAETFVIQEPASALRVAENFDRSMAYAIDRLPTGTVTGLHAPGRAASVLLDEARQAEMIVVGSRGRSAVAAALLGSVSATVAAHAGCPVVVARPASHGGMPGRPVVVGVDGSEDSYHALRFGFSEASARELPVKVVHCSPTLAADATTWSPAFESLVPRLSDTLLIHRTQFPDVDVTTRLIKGPPHAVLADESRDAELLVVGSRGRGRLTGLLLGSVSQNLLHHAHCAVAVMHEEPS